MYSNNVIKLNYRLMQDTERHISINTLTVLPSKFVLHSYKTVDNTTNSSTSFPDVVFAWTHKSVVET